ncbi:MAG: acyl-CoA dehydrogenase [Beijerinckiaceae bacterium]|nr:acyl-CoA dehydrogenase [Beijerinckiaceae bacterium]MCZ8299209.1 acyl-CoA dehydrogenase [Beijerinckiaceae bacterium]
MRYRAPVDAIRFSLEVHGGLDPALTEGILEEAARFAEQRLAPENRRADMLGARFDSGEVTTPPGWTALYRDWAEAGWNGVDLPEAWGGMGLSTRLAAATMEFWTSACMAFALGPVLTQGAVDTLEIHGSDALKALYLPRLVSGEWTATMNLTEPQAGSDLGLLRSQAEPAGDGSWRIRGSKIFITFGEHDLTENIIHLVLARLPDAPEGSKGISLFLVPKFLPDGDGCPGRRNDVACTGIEHKLGIHGSPTCSMSFGQAGGAIGWLVGEPNRGLACMFTMMNKARLYTGLQGVALAERAFQHALAFARERKQGRAPGGLTTSAIIDHPDVRRNLLRMRGLTAAGRAIAYRAAQAIDIAHAGGPGHEQAAERAALLTPIVKAYGSDLGCEVTSLGIQIHGGMGYVEETGAAQLFRDARITPIYEGTNGIQAIDLLFRKILRPGSGLAEEMIGELAATAEAARSAGLPQLAEACAEAAPVLAEAIASLRQNAGATERLLGAATPFLRLFATGLAMGYLTEAAIVAERRLRAGDSSATCRQAMADACYFAGNEAALMTGMARAVMASLPDPDFGP